MPSQNKTKNNRARSITRIHVAKRELGQSEEDYRFMLHSITGKASLKAMTLAELFAVEEHQKKLGFKVKVRKTGKKRMSPASKHKPYDKKTMVDKIRALWIDLHRHGVVRDGSENALESWVEKMSARYNKGQGIQKLDWLGQDEYICFKVLESLKQWHKREV
ncbi:hypothetical protein ACH42_08435 [Endozoicomonas sp. (ex Bugula neritina AB1)]|nr:hypothetical protein ACH42_08435 [Endozoicomonas sp. (ex Bugula neritina AB1)]